MLRASKGKLDTKAIADVIETELNEATSEREEGERRRLAERLMLGHLNLQKRDKEDAIRILEDILSRLRRK
jgi:hypothetical protein